MESVLKEREDGNPKHKTDYQISSWVHERSDISVFYTWW